jgi:hypothetical protein
VALAACSPDFRVIGDPTVPIDLDVSTGSPHTRLGGTTGVVTAVFDTGSPLSTLANAAGCTPTTPLEIHNAGDLDRLRLTFLDQHPLCGTGDSVLGGDLLARYELVFPAARCATRLGCFELLPGEIEPTVALAAEGYATLSFHLLPPSGATQLDPALGVVQYPATRVPIRACINPPAAFDPAATDLGLSANLLLATGIAPLVLGDSARNRLGLALADPPDAPALTLPGSDAHVTTMKVTPIDRMALIGQTVVGTANPGPCGELQRARCLLAGASLKTCNRPLLPSDEIDNDSDREPFVMLAGPIASVVIADDTPYLQAARNDVRPRVPDADGFLGAEILGRLREVRVDYLGVAGDSVDPGPRMIVQCDPTDSSCVTSPRHVAP